MSSQSSGMRLLIGFILLTASFAAGAVDQIWVECLCDYGNGTVTGLLEIPSDQDSYVSTLNFCRRNGDSHPRTSCSPSWKHSDYAAQPAPEYPLTRGARHPARHNPGGGIMA